MFAGIGRASASSGLAAMPVQQPAWDAQCQKFRRHRVILGTHITARQQYRGSWIHRELSAKLGRQAAARQNGSENKIVIAVGEQGLGAPTNIAVGPPPNHGEAVKPVHRGVVSHRAIVVWSKIKPRERAAKFFAKIGQTLVQGDEIRREVNAFRSVFVHDCAPSSMDTTDCFIFIDRRPVKHLIRFLSDPRGFRSHPSQ